jgi:hypothetical protein
LGGHAHISVCRLHSGIILSVAIAGPKEEALAVLGEWTKAFAASDVDAIVKLNAPDALFMGREIRRS